MVCFALSQWFLWFGSVDVPPPVKEEKPALKFIPSKWETVDESELESQGDAFILTFVN